MDYAIPRATDVPPVVIDKIETVSSANALGAKGVGEAGCIGIPAAVVNAVADALSVHGIDHLDMPLTSEKIWRALQSGKHLAEIVHEILEKGCKIICEAAPQGNLGRGFDALQVRPVDRRGRLSPQHHPLDGRPRHRRAIHRRQAGRIFLDVDRGAQAHI
jgi:hypothetical protein